MEYIRTKDTIKLFNGPYHGYELDRQADTIEELCDEYVHYENKHCCVVGDVEAREMATANYGTIYGAIWVFDGKGVPTLKPVAKMNKKGELKLL